MCTYTEHDVRMAREGFQIVLPARGVLVAEEVPSMPKGRTSFVIVERSTDGISNNAYYYNLYGPGYTIANPVYSFQCSPLRYLIFSVTPVTPFICIPSA